MERFYGDLLGLDRLAASGDRLAFAPGGGGFQLDLEVDEGAPERPPGSVGLFHLAIRVPGRASLAALLARLRDREVPLTGASDHGVSEAIYLSDPEGNGVEIYRDRPQADWPTRGDEVAMVTEPLSLEDLLGEAKRPEPLPPATDLGHVHLQVDSLAEAGDFYRALGLRVRQSTYPGALFLAAGDYHHHVGLNAWGSPSVRARETLGLVGFTFSVPGDAWEAWRSGLEIDPVQEGSGSAAFEDPIGARVEARAFRAGRR